MEKKIRIKCENHSEGHLIDPNTPLDEILPDHLWTNIIEENGDITNAVREKTFEDGEEEYYEEQNKKHGW